LQRLVGARGRKHHLALYFFSGAGYARPAREYADGMDIALFKYALDGCMSAVNSAAQAVMRSAAHATPTLTAPTSPPVDPVELRFWSDVSAERGKAASAANAGWLRRHGWLLFALVWAYICVGTTLEAVGVTDPPEGAQRVGFGPIPIAAAMAVGGFLLWHYLDQRRKALVERQPSLPPTRPMRAHEVEALRAVSSASLDERLRAVREAHANIPIRD
jgi:hypothetical protein